MSFEPKSKLSALIPREKAFYFFTSIGNYTGFSASSLKEFMDKINEVDVRSLEFHLYRGDFEKWMNEVLEEGQLAEDIKRLQKLNLTGDGLRSQLYLSISRRLKRLTNPF